MKYFRVTPQSPGTLGQDTVIEDLPNGKREMTFFHLELTRSPEAIVRNFDQYAVEDRLKRKIHALELTGADFEVCKLTKDEENYEDDSDPDQIPSYFRMKIHGVFDRDDFIRDNRSGLIASERAVSLLKEFGLEDVYIEALAK